MFSNVLTVIAYTLSFGLLLLVLGRNLHRRLPVFTLFVVSFVTRDVISLFVVYTPFFRTLTWIYFYWTSEFILTGIYLFVIFEIAELFLCDYPSIWRFASRLLESVALALMCWTVYSAFRFLTHPRLFNMVGEQHLLLTITVLILVVMGIGTYYHLRIAPLYRLVLIGIGIYASVQVAANQMVIQFRLYEPNPLWDSLRRGSFAVAMALWAYGVWRWAGPPVRHAELIPQAKYDDLSPQVHDCLRDVIQKLANLAGQRP